MTIRKNIIIPVVLFFVCLLIQSIQLYAIECLWHNISSKIVNLLSISDAEHEMVNRFTDLYSFAPLLFFIIGFIISTFILRAICRKVTSKSWHSMLMMCLFPAALLIIMLYPFWSLVVFGLGNIIWCYNIYRTKKVLWETCWILARNSTGFGVLFSIMVWLFVWVEMID